MFRYRTVIPLMTMLIVGTLALLYGTFSAFGQNSVQEGMAVTAYYSGFYQTAESDQAVENIAATGAEWLTILVTQYQSTTSSTTISANVRTPTDADLVHIINKAKSLGLKVVLKPHVDVENPSSEWRGRIGQNFNESQWSAWFSSYRNFIGHYADFAAENSVEQIVIGTELVITSQRESEWRTVVSHVRDRYDGKLTYSANHSGEEINVQWWDAIDYIGISGYYNLTDKTDPTVAELKAAWQSHITTLSALSQQWNRPIIFTEIGYRSSDGNNTHPWCHYCDDEPVDLQEQADTYQAFFESVYNQPWFAGVHWWSWGLRAQDNGICNDGYSPHLKPAENILRQYYGGSPITIPTTCDGTAPTATPGAPPTAVPATATTLPATPTVVPPTTVPPTTVPPTTVPPTTVPPTVVPPTTVPGQCGGLRQEAEAATIGAGNSGNGAFTIGSDSDASAGNYIEASESRSDGSYTPNANATFCINVPAAGTYGLRSRASAENSSGDSLFFYVDGAPISGNIWYLWATGSFVVTDLYTTQIGASTQSRFEIQLAAGEHEIAFSGREQGPRIDWFELVLLDDSPIEPTATSVPPTATSVPPTATSVPPTATSVPPTATSVPPTATPVPSTATPVPPTATPIPPTVTSAPPTTTPLPPTVTSLPPTATPLPPTATSLPPTATPVPPTATVVPATPVPPTATPAPAEGCSPLQQEAEDGELIGLFEVGNDSAASGGQSVSVTNGGGNRGVELDDAQKIVLCVSIDTPGPYWLRAWTYSPSGFDNSFYVRVDGQPVDGILWHTQISDEYVNEYVSDYNATTNLFQQMEFVLDAGEHQIEFLLREDGVHLDKIAFEPAVLAASSIEQFFSDRARLQNDISLVTQSSTSIIYMPIIE